VLFTIRSLLFCAKCKEDKLLNKGRRRAKAIPVIRPRIWLYNDFNYLDAKAINKVRAIDLKAKPNIVIIVSTMLKVKLAKVFVQDICYIA
jgi:NAD-dependent SIR2 family protein deacetylase